MVRKTSKGRSDGRRANELRPVTIRRGYLKNAEGSALIEMGGTRVTSTAIPFSQADWIQHYGPIWESFRDAKNRFDPHNVLTPGQGIFPSAVGERRV